MRIQTLALKNFRSHQQTVLELDRFNFIRGPNGCGKSSIQMALEYLFTGRCQLTDGAGRGAEALIRAGEKDLEISATLEGGETISRRRTRKSQAVEINGKRVPVDAAESFLTKHFGPADVLSTVLNADHFAEMSETAQRRVLAQMVDAGKIDILDEIRQALRAINEEIPRLESVADIETAYKRFCDLHTEATRALQALVQPEKAGTGSGLPRVEKAEEQPRAAQREMGWLTLQKSDADTCWRNAQSPSHQADAELEYSLLEIPSLWEDEQLHQIDSPLYCAKELSRQLADMIAEREALQASLTVRQSLKDKCPTCGQAISETAKVKAIDAVREKLADLQGEIQRTREELNCYSDPEGAASSPADHHRALTDQKHVSGEESGVRATLKPDAANPGDRAIISREMTNNRERVVVKPPQPEIAKGREAYSREKSALEKKLSILERLMEYFGPNGAIMKQAGSQMELFKEKLNKQLAAFGYRCRLTLEPFEIRVISSACGEPGLLLKQFSESECFRFGIAFQIALAAITGIRFVVIDRADVLDRARRRELTALLLSNEIDQAIVLASGEEPAPLSIPAGVKFIDLAQATKSRGAHRLEPPSLELAR